MQDVTKDRAKYIGGSDIPVIMGISPFKKRFELLQEKAEIKDNEFNGNTYTEYGNVLEPKIRAYINKKYETEYLEDVLIKEPFRGHFDGYNGKSILEIKTTSQIKENVEDYKVYLVQLVLYMHLANVKDGILAIYERPEDFNEDFAPERLTIFEIKSADYKILLDEIIEAVDLFLIDLAKMKENPFITEEDLQPKEVIELSSQIIELETQLASIKPLEAEIKELKDKLYKAMTKGGIKKWTTNTGVQITRVDPTKDTTTKAFDEKKFSVDHKDLYKEYQLTKIKKGRAGYLKITQPKNCNQ
ncbi:MAG: YqaJ viral recombinase family protein [Peptostreptococcaceae bacterium]|nr:YqaJ viral recombinase family protein [Peptostreptococcaceae bacterium]MDY5738665.1 YqaJ viral recombinase family protein [Anaerovoracaceae bacterium]